TPKNLTDCIPKLQQNRSQIAARAGVSYILRDAQLRFPRAAPRVRSGIYVACRRRSEAGYLHDDRFIARFSEVRATGRFGVKASGRKRLQLSPVERVAVAYVPRPRHNGRHTVVLMVVGGNARV